jgi:AmmeMemoRadiSam system protein B
MAVMEFRGVREPAIAGTWYPGSPTALRRTIEEYLSRVPAQALPGEIIGLIAPHAGYMYSGQVAAYAYRQIKGRQYDRVIVVSPVHRAYIARAQAVVTAVEYYRTPLGDIPVDVGFLRRLAERIPLGLLRDDDEHSLEIQLPFLQVTLPSFHLVPIMMADQSLLFCQDLGQALAEAVRKEAGSTLFVASTDLSHFYHDRTARELDQTFIRYVEAYDVPGLAHAVGQGKTEACGAGPVITVMTACKLLGAREARILHYANSGDVTGDFSRVVGYAAGVILR